MGERQEAGDESSGIALFCTFSTSCQQIDCCERPGVRSWVCLRREAPDLLRRGVSI